MVQREIRRWCGHVVTVAVLTGAIAAVAAATTGRQTNDLPRQQLPPILNESLAGRDSFDRYCAACHGTTARGDGPVGPQLKTRPPDLTQLARRNGGTFPASRVSAYVSGTGRALPTHGPAEMPVWGPTFRAFEKDIRAQERIKNLVLYLASIQAPSSAPGSEGARLFQEHCAGCHGTGGTGAAPAGLRRQPPDLTQFTARNGGVFPGERVARIIDGRDVASHGDREMPVWGFAFRATRDGLTQDQVAARIAAIVVYLEAIQRRNG
jgi:mono/diheme cytochrome c family protein